LQDPGERPLKHAFFRPEAATATEHTAASMPAAPLSWRVVGAFIAAATAVLLAFIATAGYARKETASGALVSTAGLVRVAARREGFVTELKVREGEQVLAGQALFTIESEQGLSNGRTLGEAQLASLDDQVRLIRDQIAAEPARVANDIMRSTATIQSVLAQHEAVAAQRQLQSERVKAAQERRQALMELYQKGSATKVSLQDQESLLLVNRQSIADLDRRMAGIDKDLEQAQLQRDQLPVQQNERLSQLRLSLADRERERAEIAARGSQVVRAPLAGRVTALQATLGQSVDQSRPLLTLIPDGADLQAEIFVPSRAIGFVRPGQRVRLMIEAFPYQRFGTREGTTALVSEAVLAPNEVYGKVALKEPAYRVTVRLDEQTIQAFGRAVPLQPDMAVQADIILEERSLLAWLLEPLMSVRGRM
jgi:membrane fusion protein